MNLLGIKENFWTVHLIYFKSEEYFKELLCVSYYEILMVVKLFEFSEFSKVFRWKNGGRVGRIGASVIFLFKNW